MNDARRPPQPAKPAESLPVAPGTVLGKISRADAGTDGNLTEMERRVLEQAGGGQTKGIPDLTNTTAGQRLAAEVSKLRQQASPEAIEGAPLPLNTPPIKPVITEIEDLSPEEQVEVRRRIASMQAMEAFDEAGTAPEQIQGIEGMQEAYAAAVHGNVTEPGNVELVNDLAKPQASASPPPPTQPVDPPQRPQPDSGFSPLATPAAAAPPPPPPPPPTDTTVASEEPDDFDPTQPQQGAQQAEQEEGQYKRGEGDAGGKDVHPTHCPRCNWDLHKKPLEVTNFDKLSFIQCVMGARFEKDVTILDGLLQIRLRGLLPAEEDLAQHQLAVDMQAGRVVTMVEYDYTYNNYRLAMAIGKIVRRGQPPQIFKPIDEVAFDKTKHATAIPQLVEYLNKHVYMMNTVRRVIGQEWIRMNELFNYMEEQSKDPDFLKGIEQLT